MVHSSVAGITLLVLVSMATPDLVCGGQESGRDLRLTHTHFAHNLYHTPQTGGVKGMTFQKTLRYDAVENTPDSGQVFQAESRDVKPWTEPKPDGRNPNPVWGRVELSENNGSDGIECNNCVNDGRRSGVKFNRVSWDEVPDVTLYFSQDPKVHTHTEHRAAHTHTEDPVVLTHSGPVRGLTLDKAHVFYGIPYAAPPVGSGRWVAPQAVPQWTKPYDATFPRAACMQACAGEFSEACPHKVMASPPITS